MVYQTYRCEVHALHPLNFVYSIYTYPNYMYIHQFSIITCLSHTHDSKKINTLCTYTVIKIVFQGEKLLINIITV